MITDTGGDLKRYTGTATDAMQPTVRTDTVADIRSDAGADAGRSTVRKDTIEDMTRDTNIEADARHWTVRTDTIRDIKRDAVNRRKTISFKHKETYRHKCLTLDSNSRQQLQT